MSESNEGQLQDYSVDQLAGAIVLVLGAVGSLLLVVWQSKCHCKVNLCYIFQCERRPPNEEEMANLKEQANKLKDKKNNKAKPKPKPEPEPEPERHPVFDRPSAPEPEPEFVDANDEENPVARVAT
tara:strand:- start:69 stop:446 length:378 start_codon:yes stop_codon:yes gene_type:complete